MGQPPAAIVGPGRAVARPRGPGLPPVSRTGSVLYIMGMIHTTNNRYDTLWGMPSRQPLGVMTT
jgi:hypothetical protein